MFCEKCGAEIGDDAQFCPRCGFNVRPIIAENVNKRRRHGFTTFWLTFSLISFTITGMVYLYFSEAIAQYVDVSSELLIFLSLVSMAGIVGNVLLLCWKKIGFWIFIGISIVSFIINMRMGLNIAQSLSGIIGIAIMWGVLHIHKDDKTAWEQLE
jgi:predicted nucleic acid-binding Zn ribbon protein